jgi:endonuclease-3 related protein
LRLADIQMNILADRINEIYELLLEAYGPQQWWPAESPLEVLVGAVLTQNTNWQGVEKAMTNVKNHNLLDPHKLKAMSIEELAQLIKPAGYFNLKARRLKNLIDFIIKAYAGDLEAMGQTETGQLRKQLLAVNGVGPETADSILLYGLERPVFVVDTYTYRVASRHGLIGEEASYDELQELFTLHLPLEVKLFNEYHALLVKVGKLHCKRNPHCRGCPLEPLLP